MPRKEELVSFSKCGWHKGFYNDENITKSLCEIKYTDFFENLDDDEFPYDSAHAFLRGSCNHFAVALQKVIGYNPYIIEGKNKVSFHAFCQLYKGGMWYYIDARGITTSFDEFMIVAREFVSDEYTIRPATLEDTKEWEKDSNYNEEAYAFAEAVIRKFQTYYTL